MSSSAVTLVQAASRDIRTVLVHWRLLRRHSSCFASWYQLSLEASMLRLRPGFGMKSRSHPSGAHRRYRRRLQRRSHSGSMLRRLPCLHSSAKTSANVWCDLDNGMGIMGIEAAPSSPFKKAFMQAASILGSSDSSPSDPSAAASSWPSCSALPVHPVASVAFSWTSWPCRFRRSSYASRSAPTSFGPSAWLPEPCPGSSPLFSGFSPLFSGFWSSWSCDSSVISCSSSCSALRMSARLCLECSLKTS